MVYDCADDGLRVATVVHQWNPNPRTRALRTCSHHHWLPATFGILAVLI